MASAEREPITRVWGGADLPAGSRGTAPGQGVRESGERTPPPEAESILSFKSANGAQNLSIFVTL